MPKGTGGSNPSLSATLSLLDKEGQIKPSTMEKYPSGRRGSPAKGVGCVSAARVQIPASPPKPCQTTFRQGSFYVWKGKISPKAPNSFFCPMKNDCHFQTDAESERPLRACFFDFIQFNLSDRECAQPYFSRPAAPRRQRGCGRWHPRCGGASRVPPDRQCPRLSA